MKKVLFVSSNQITREVELELSKAIGMDLAIDTREIVFSDGSELLEFQDQYDEFVVVAPNSIMCEIIKTGIKPLSIVTSYREADGKTKRTTPRIVGIKRNISIEEEWLTKND